MTWLATQDVLDALGLDQSGPNLDRALVAAQAHVSSWRDDIQDWSVVKATHPAVYEAAVQAAALLYQSHVTPEGFSGFSEVGEPLIGAEGSKWVQIRRLARANRPKVG